MQYQNVSAQMWECIKSIHSEHACSCKQVARVIIYRIVYISIHYCNMHNGVKSINACALVSISNLLLELSLILKFAHCLEMQLEYVGPLRMIETLNSTLISPMAMETFLFTVCQQYVGTAVTDEREQLQFFNWSSESPAVGSSVVHKYALEVQKLWGW